MRILSFLFLLGGLILISFGGYQIITGKVAQGESIQEAKEVIEQSNEFKKNSPEKKAAPVDFLPEDGEAIGILDIPALNSELPIIEGTHEDELAKGVGHYKGTALPMQKDQIVLSGHRDTVFRRMGELEIGDTVTLKMPYGDYSYEIVETKIVDANDRSIIVPTAPEEVLTISTCYPFSYVGSAPDRYIITALPID